MRAMFIAIFILACCAAVLHAGCCPRTFTYCGSTLNVARLGSECGIELDPQTLYSCHSSEQPTVVKKCANGCIDGLAGQNDYCKE
ncbi:hypothetical protein RvY_09944 [Ramazzottius varieornatus]|uniref:Uncharacterized protein n=1 Tax=Ramazzottius varieornatus TaxID=947166 RepID=A0A1D1VGG3_RAMVA|nr:hypothetical protein RvY_09944 [Ramazzottius varieornatus]